MMADDQQATSGVSRRKFIATSGAIGAAGLAGCSGNQSTPTEGDSGGRAWTRAC